MLIDDFHFVEDFTLATFADLIFIYCSHEEYIHWLSLRVNFPTTFFNFLTLLQALPYSSLFGRNH